MFTIPVHKLRNSVMDIVTADLIDIVNVQSRPSYLNNCYFWTDNSLEFFIYGSEFLQD